MSEKLLAARRKKMSALQASRQWRAALRADPERYRAYLKKGALRQAEWAAKAQLDPDKWAQWLATRRAEWAAKAQLDPDKWAQWLATRRERAKQRVLSPAAIQARKERRKLPSRIASDRACHKNWYAAQMADPQKRAALKRQDRLKHLRRKNARAQAQLTRAMHAIKQTKL